MTETLIYLGLGSNLGDRQSTILQALQRLRAIATIDAVSSFYETPPAGGVGGPAFLNVAATVRTSLDIDEFERALRGIETALGRGRARAPLDARAIDFDVLLVEGVVRDYGRFEVPHPYLGSRPFNLIPLAEIAAGVIDPRSGQTIEALAARSDATNIVKKRRSLHFTANRQEEAPDVRLSIDRAGVSNIKRVVHVRSGGRDTAYNAEFSMVADLAPDRAGVHMSRFSELLEEATLDVLADVERPAHLEDVATAVARRIVTSQRAVRADVRLRAQFGLERWTPVSGKRSEETFTLVAIAHADERGMRRVVGIEAEGMTACPCAQQMVREHALGELLDAGFDEAAANRALDVLPVATHNQRGRGSVLIGADGPRAGEIAAEDLVEIVENSMSSETYDLLKRPDEFFVVNKAHRNPRFVEDVVRAILSQALAMYADFPGETFAFASQVNYESIHKHDAFAEAFGTFDELHAELRTGAAASRKTGLAAWLGTKPSPVIV